MATDETTHHNFPLMKSIDRGESFEVEDHQRVKISRLLRGKQKQSGDVYNAFLSSFQTTFNVSVNEDDRDSMDGFSAGYVRGDGGADEQSLNSEQAFPTLAATSDGFDSSDADNTDKQHGAENKLRTLSSEGSAEASTRNNYENSAEARMTDDTSQLINFSENASEQTSFSGQTRSGVNDSVDQTRFSADGNGDLTATQSRMDEDFTSDSARRAVYAADSQHSSFENLDQDNKPLIGGDAGEDLDPDDNRLDQENLDPKNMPFELFKKKKDKKKKKNKDAADKSATDDASSATADPTSTELQTSSVAADGGDVTRTSATEDGSKAKAGDTSDVKIDLKGEDSSAVLQTAEGGTVSMTTAEGPQLAQSEGVVDTQPTKSQGREKESLLHDHSPEGLICCVIL